MQLLDVANHLLCTTGFTFKLAKWEVQGWTIQTWLNSPSITSQPCQEYRENIPSNMVIGSVIGHYMLHVTGVKHPRKDEKTLILTLIRFSMALHLALHAKCCYGL